MGLFDFLSGGGGGDQPSMPSYDVNSAMSNQYLQQLWALAQQGIGKTLQEPGEYGYTSDYLKNLMGYKPDQFQFPMADIQKALASQQELQMQDYMKQLNPVMAQQGNLDSTYYANMIGDYLKGQQSQTYGTTADLLTQQALNNMQIQQWLPQFQSGVAGQLAGVGGQRANVSQYNMEYPYKTYIPAISDIFGQGMDLAEQQYQSAMLPYMQELQKYQQNQANQASGISSLGSLAGMGLGALFALPTGGMSVAAGSMLGGALGGTAGSLFGGSQSPISMSNALQYAYPQYNTGYYGGRIQNRTANTQWGNLPYTFDPYSGQLTWSKTQQQ